MTGRTLKELGFEEVVGVEIREDVVARMAQASYDRVITGDVEKMQLPYEEGHFDCILYGDVLEHLIDPWRLLREHNLLLGRGAPLFAASPMSVTIKT